MVKRYSTLAIVYAVVAMVFGVFYREFTKFTDFTGDTTLSVMHTHYFALGMVFFLLLAVAEKSMPFSQRRGSKVALITYQIGLNITGLGFLVRGLVQVLGTEIGPGADAALSGVAGLGHVILGISIIVFLVNIRKSASELDVVPTA